MKQKPELQNRLSIPATPLNFHLSARIKNLHQQMQNRRAVLVAAPAGYGKTTLLSTFAAAQNKNTTRVAWYSLEQRDQQADLFFAYLTESLLPSGDNAREETRRILDCCVLDRLNIYRFFSALCKEIWLHYHKHPSVSLYIVLDDYHHIAHIPSVQQVIIYLLHNLPPNCSIYLSSRYEINVFSEKQKLNNGIIEIGAEELRLSANEIYPLYSDISDIKTDSELIERTTEYTEGWAAGIMIMRKALKGSNADYFLKGIESAAGNSSIYNYFSSEVVATIDSNLLSFLLKLSLLREFSAADAQIFLELPDNAVQVLESCIARGLFMQKNCTDDTIYRFHTLFREVLSRMLPDYFSCEEIKELQLKAANYYLSKKAYRKGIEQLLNCQDPILINEILLEERINMDVFEDIRQLQILFDQLPEDIVANNMVLLFVKGLTNMHIDYEEACRILAMAFEKSRLDGNYLMRLNIALALVYAYFSTNNMKAMKKILAQVQKPELPYPNPGIEAADTLLEMIKAVFSDRLRAADSLNEKIKPADLEKNLRWPFHIITCMLCFRLGKHDRAINAIQEALGLEEISKSPVLSGLAYTFYSFPLLFKKNIAALEPVIAEVLSTGEKYRFHYLQANGQLIRAYISYMDNKPEKAWQCLDKSAACFKEMKNPAMSEFSKLLKYLWKAQYEESWELLVAAENSLEIIRKHQAGHELYEIGQSILGVLYRNQGHYHEAEHSLLAAIRCSEKKGAIQVSCGASIHLAKLYFNRGDHKQGIEFLHKAFDLASTNSFFMFWDMQYPVLIEMAAQAVRLGLHTDYALKLTEEHFGAEGRQAFSSRLTLSNSGNLEDFSRDFVSSVCFGIDNPWPRIKVCFLGSFTVQVNQEFLPEEVWKTKKIKRLFIYLLLNKGKAISREHLAGLFWPESDKKCAAMSFRSALYELKRIISHYGMFSQEDSNLIRETAAGLKISNYERLNTDLDEFHKLNQIRITLSIYSDRADHLINTLEKMISLYRGDLLEYESYDDWILIEQEKLKSIFIDSALQLSREYIKKKNYRRAEQILLKILSHDNYNEEAACLLIELYIGSSQKSRAIQFFNSFRGRLEGDLGIAIDPGLSVAINTVRGARGQGQAFQ